MLESLKQNKMMRDKMIKYEINFNVNANGEQPSPMRFVTKAIMDTYINMQIACGRSGTVTTWLNKNTDNERQLETTEW